MKKFNFAKIVSLIFVCAMLMGALTIAALAAGEDDVVIASNNVYYGEKYQIMYAIKAPKGATITATDSKGNAVAIIPFEEEPTVTLNDVQYNTYVTKGGVAAQAIDEVITITVEANGKTATQSYSVLQYIYERMYVSNIAEGKELAMLEALLEYADAANAFLDGATVSFSEYKYVTVVDGTLDGNNTAGMFPLGATPFENITANIKLESNQSVEWTVSVEGGEAAVIELADLKTLTVTGNMTVTATAVEKICNHVWADANCTTPKTCSVCGETEGEALGHTWTDANCTTPKTCSVCGETEGEALGHTWTDATCQAPKTCSACGATEGEVAECADNDENGRCDTCDAILTYLEVTIPEAIELADNTPVKVSGTVVSIDTPWDESYGNITVTIQDAEGNKLKLYRLATNVAKGDIITATGTLTTYSDARQLAQGCTAEITGHDDSYDQGPVEMTIADALAAAEGTDVIITGTVTKIDTPYNSQYDNVSVYITDEETGATVLVYRMTGNVEVGAIIKVTGQVGSYNETKQIAQGATFETIGTHECTEYTEATCTKLAECVLCGKTTGELAEHNIVEGVCTVCGLAEGVSTTETTYTFSSYPAGTQYGENEEHELSETLTVVTNKGHFTTELRLYSSSTYNATAIFKSTISITKIKVNAGNKVDVLVVYGSNDDGATWTELTKISVTSTSYNDYEADLGGSYKWIKLDVEGTQQVRLKSITLTTINCAHSSTTTTTTEATCTEAGCEIITCDACGAEISKEEVEAALGHSYDEGQVTTKATCTEAGVKTYTCEACGDKKTEDIEAPGHTDANTDGVCDTCQAVIEQGGGEDPEQPAEPQILATFELGTATTDSSTAKTTYTETDGNYTLNISGEKMYTGYGSNESGLKFGSSSAKGTCTFKVASNVTKVVIYACKYSSDSTKIVVNGTTYTLSSEYQKIEVTQLTENTEWTVTVEPSTSSKQRFYIHQIEFIGIE